MVALNADNQLVVTLPSFDAETYPQLVTALCGVLGDALTSRGFSGKSFDNANWVLMFLADIAPTIDQSKAFLVPTP